MTLRIWLAIRSFARKHFKDYNEIYIFFISSCDHVSILPIILLRYWLSIPKKSFKTHKEFKINDPCLLYCIASLFAMNCIWLFTWVPLNVNLHLLEKPIKTTVLDCKIYHRCVSQKKFRNYTFCKIFINQSHVKLIRPFEFSRMENAFFKVVLIFFIYVGCILITELRSVLPDSHYLKFTESVLSRSQSLQNYINKFIPPMTLIIPSLFVFVNICDFFLFSNNWRNPLRK